MSFPHLHTVSSMYSFSSLSWKLIFNDNKLEKRSSKATMETEKENI